MVAETAEAKLFKVLREISSLDGEQAKLAAVRSMVEGVGLMRLDTLVQMWEIMEAGNLERAKLFFSEGLEVLRF